MVTDTEAATGMLRVLVVDDDLIVRMMLRAALLDAGFVVDEAVHGAECLERFAELRPDAILLDAIMPVLDGFETCARLQDLPDGRDTPVLMITAREDVKFVERAFASGVTDIITKPLYPEILAQRLRQIALAQRAGTLLRENEERFRTMADTAPVLLWIAGMDGQRSFFNRPWLEFTGRTSDVEADGGWITGVHPDDVRRCSRTYRKAFRERRRFRMEYRLRRADGLYRWILDTGVPRWTSPQEFAGYIGSCVDITERKEAEDELQLAKQELEARVAERMAELHHANELLRIELANRQRAQAQLAHDALHDALTGLPNRALFLDRLQQAMEHARRHPDYTFAVLFLDLDRFKTINDSLGHMIGDKLLIETARRLQTCVRPSDTVARLGGDEFAILLDEIGVVRGAAQVVARIHATLNRPSVFEGHQIVANTSIGIAFYEPGYSHPDEILRDADIAMYRAKSQGKAGYEIFRPEMHSRAVEELRLEAELRNALEQRQFVLYYQPIITATNGRITHVEALLRWQHPQRGLIGPGEFMHAADEAGLMVLIGEWVMCTGCAQVRAWQQAGIPELSLSVNLTTRQFKQKDLSAMIARVLQETGLPARYLALEMTESSLMGDAEGTTTALEALGALGVHLALDNFGTGYSSLNYLKRFPLTTLKIDRSFVGQITTNPDDAGVATAIIAMAHRLNLNVVAEGVETEAQLDFLKPYHCDSVQGYFLSPPLAADAMAERLQEERHKLSTRRSNIGVAKVRRSTNVAARSHDHHRPG